MKLKLLIFCFINFCTLNVCYGKDGYFRKMIILASIPTTLLSEARWLYNNQTDKTTESAKYPLSKAETVAATSLSVVTAKSLYDFTYRCGSGGGGINPGIILYRMMLLGSSFAASSIGYSIIAHGYYKEFHNKRS
jgi:hypothetical protein